MAHQEHIEVIAAIANRDTSAARAAMTRHVAATAARLQRFLEKPSTGSTEY
jgi:DNA-binding GntR family transcriptional regulator